MAQSNDQMRTRTDADQEPPVTTPPSQETAQGGTRSPADADTRDGGEDIRDDDHRSTTYQKAEKPA